MGAGVSMAGRLVYGGIGLMLCMAGCATVPPATCMPQPIQAAPLFSRDVDATWTSRERILGPFIEQSERSTGEQLTSVRPFVSRYDRPSTGYTSTEVLWPLYSHHRINDRTSWRFLFFFGGNGDVTDPESRYHVWLIPLWFHGRDSRGEAYAALFPIGGTIRDFIGLDRISFLLFPLHETHEVDGVQSKAWLWPIFTSSESSAAGDGPAVKRRGVFPLYGTSHREAQWHRKYVAWPFYTSVRYYGGRFPEGGGSMLFPIYGHSKLEGQESWTLLPPFFSYQHNDEGFRRVRCPWPFIQITESETERKWEFFPIWGFREDEFKRKSYFLWPIARRHESFGKRVTEDRQAILPFWFQEKRWFHFESGEREQRLTYYRLWPLFSYLREGEQSRFRVPDLWFAKNTPPIERTWVPLWTLYSRQRAEGEVAHELLWGLWRHVRYANGTSAGQLFPLWSWDQRSETRSWSLAAGLLKVSDDDGMRRMRCLYLFDLPLGRATLPPEPEAP